MDNINISKIISNNNIVRLFPTSTVPNLQVPSVSYRYSPTIRSSVTNYRQVINEGITPTTCNCNTIDNKYKDSGHVFTGDLNLIPNIQLRTLMKKGLNFREIPPPNKDKVYNSISSSLDTYIDKVSPISSIAKVLFKPWKIEILRLVRAKLDKLNCYKFDNVLSKTANIRDLKSFHSKWVFIPTDKASNNITIVCKKHYMSLLDQEIVQSGNFQEDTNTDIATVINNDVDFLKKYNLSTSRRLPYLFWIAKLHKVPISQRFITSGRGCTTQPLSIKIGYCLKTILDVVQKNSSFHRRKHNIKKSFIIENRDPVLDFIRCSNQNNNVTSISTFDFKTLYTSIPHVKLKLKIASVIKNAFTSRKKNYVTVVGSKAVFTDIKKPGFSLSIAELIECVNFIVDHSYIVYKGKLFRQVIGIPMGTNCAPYLANLFLYAYEEAFINSMSCCNKQHIAKSLSDSFRFQDDCIVFNDQGIFEAKWKEIYPVEMQLEKTNTGNSCTFLDLNISIVEGKFIYKSYDKRLNYNFEVINYPNLVSNVPQNPSYGVFNSQLVRFCDVNSNLDSFVSDVSALTNKLVQQNFDIKELKARFKKFYIANLLRWSKFGSDIINILEISY